VSEAREAGPVSLWFRRALGWAILAPYLRFVRATSRVVYDPPDFWAQVDANWPAILTSWHGQSNLSYAVFPQPERFGVMTSIHPDGQIVAGLARSFGVTLIAGSGASDRQRHGTGGVAAFRQTLRLLKDGYSAFATGDVPPVRGRNLSPGLIAMSQRSGRPVFCIAIVSSRRRVLDRVWDKMLFPLPFSRIAFVGEGPFYCEAEGAPDEVKASLDRVLEKAFQLADAGEVSSAPAPR
jgi:lysophospholipid acyltransferase (LPLAT)-like uncharacterized protein